MKSVEKSVKGAEWVAHWFDHSGNFQKKIKKDHFSGLLGRWDWERSHLYLPSGISQSSWLDYWQRGIVNNAARSSVEKSQGYRYTLPWLSQYLDHVLRERNKERLVQEYGQATGNKSQIFGFSKKTRFLGGEIETPDMYMYKTWWYAVFDTKLTLIYQNIGTQKCCWSKSHGHNFQDIAFKSHHPGFIYVISSKGCLR